MPFGATDDSLNPRQQFGFVERLCQIVVGTVTQAFDLFVGLAQAGQNQNRRIDFGCSQVFQNFIAVHVRQHQIKNDNVVVIELSDFQAVFAKVGGVHNHPFFFEHRLNTLRDGVIIFN